MISHSDIIIEHGYTGLIDHLHISEIEKSMMIGIITKRLVYLKEFMSGLDSYGLTTIIQAHPHACRSLFVQDTEGTRKVDANYLFSIIYPEYSEEGSMRRKIEECMMDYFQDFVFQLQDKPVDGSTGDGEICASSDHIVTITDVEESEGGQQFTLRLIIRQLESWVGLLVKNTDQSTAKSKKSLSNLTMNVWFKTQITAFVFQL